MSKQKVHFILLLGFLFSLNLAAQSNESVEEDAFFIRSIYDQALTEGQAYDWLMYLTQRIGGRLSGSPQAAAAVEYTRQQLLSLGLDTVYLQECMVPRWVRGEEEQVRIVNSLKLGSLDLQALALGNSVGTGPSGLTAEVVEVKSLAEVDSLGEEVRGKIVFYNRPMDPTQIRTFYAYGGAVDQRGFGPATAAKYGAVAAIVRSMTNRADDIPHTGATINDPRYPFIPSVAISTNDADLLSGLLTEEPVRVYIRTTCENLPPVKSYNVIGEITGSEKPEEIILVGGHLDSWDVGTGAHDDGAGCVHAMDVLQVLKSLDYRPKRTIRCVLFMNEENGLVGATRYKEVSFAKKEYHMAAIESDRGGFTPRGFSCEGDPSIFNKKFSKVLKWLPLLEPYGLNMSTGGSGADISGLKPQKGLLFGFMPDSQRYFDYHHTPTDGLDVVNKRELQLGVAAISSLVYLLDKYGI